MLTCQSYSSRCLAGVPTRPPVRSAFCRQSARHQFRCVFIPDSSWSGTCVTLCCTRFQCLERSVAYEYNVPSACTSSAFSRLWALPAHVLSTRFPICGQPSCSSHSPTLSATDFATHIVIISSLTNSVELSTTREATSCAATW
jgi:hypothetical protein